MGSFSLLHSQLFQPTIMLCQGRQLGVITRGQTHGWRCSLIHFSSSRHFNIPSAGKHRIWCFFGVLIVRHLVEVRWCGIRCGIRRCSDGYVGGCWVWGALRPLCPRTRPLPPSGNPCVRVCVSVAFWLKLVRSVRGCACLCVSVAFWLEHQRNS